jgi:hypothetical protein
MDERVARLKSSQDARQLAENAQRLGRLDVSIQALERARELQAIEEGYVTPAQVAIATALYAYEEEQSRLKHRIFRASRTRQMFAKHGPLNAAERMVLNRRPSKGFEVLEEAGLQELSFEAIIDRFPEEFSSIAVNAARARLKGELLPSPLRTMPTRMLSRSEASEEPHVPAVLDAEAQVFLNGFRTPDNWFMASWLPRYRQTIHAIAKALSENHPEELFDTFWKTADNHIAHAGQGLLKYDVVDGMRAELIQVIRDIYTDSSPANFARIVERFEAWKAEGRIGFVPRLLIARAFAGVHPRHYHTTVDASSQNKVLHWFIEHSGFAKPNSARWGELAHTLVTHLDRLEIFGDDIFARNIFPWFVVDQLRAPADIPPGHSPRAPTAHANLPPTQRTIVLRHNVVQAELFVQLAAHYGADKVWTEYPTGTGGYADAIARDSDDHCLLYEIKIADTAAEVVRQAMGQLLEYGFRRGGLEPTKLFAVGEPILDDVTRQFISRLSTNFNLNIDYLQLVLPATAAELCAVEDGPYPWGFDHCSRMP